MEKIEYYRWSPQVIGSLTLGREIARICSDEGHKNCIQNPRGCVSMLESGKGERQAKEAQDECRRVKVTIEDMVKFPKKVNQNIVEDGNKRPLAEFSQRAVIYLQQHPECDEVVQLADNIIELENDKMTRPDNIYELHQGYKYNFSGHFGQVIGVGRCNKPCTEENPCCDRRGEYNGYGSGPLKFVCPKHCSCHD